MKMSKGIILLGLIFVVSFSAQAEDLISKLPATTKVVAKLNLDRLRKSKFYANIEQENLAKLDLAQDKIAEQIGIDLKQVSYVWLAGVKKKEGMLVLKGTFDTETIREAISEKPSCQIVDRENCELAVYVTKRNGRGKDLAVILDEKTMAIGEPAFVDTFILTFQGNGNGLAKDKIEKTKVALAKDALFQGILLEMPEDQQNLLAAAVVNGNATLDVTDKISCTADITMTNDENAKAATQIITGLVAMYELKQPETFKGEIVKESILKNLKIEQNGSKVNINGGIGAEVLKQLIGKIK